MKKTLFTLMLVSVTAGAGDWYGPYSPWEAGSRPLTPPPAQQYRPRVMGTGRENVQRAESLELPSGSFWILRPDGGTDYYRGEGSWLGSSPTR